MKLLTIVRARQEAWKRVNVAWDVYRTTVIGTLNRHGGRITSSLSPQGFAQEWIAYPARTEQECPWTESICVSPLHPEVGDALHQLNLAHRRTQRFALRFDRHLLRHVSQQTEQPLPTVLEANRRVLASWTAAIVLALHEGGRP